MTPARVLATAVLALVLQASASVALASGRVALVVGNSTYSHIGRLPNPENDAADTAAALRRLGFEVTTAQDTLLLSCTPAPAPSGPPNSRWARIGTRPGRSLERVEQR